MSLFGDIPRHGSGWRGRAVLGAGVGAFFGLFPALLLFAAVGGTASEMTVRQVAVCLALPCLPMALLFAFLGAWRRGRGLGVLARWMSLRVRRW